MGESYKEKDRLSSACEVGYNMLGHVFLLSLFVICLRFFFFFINFRQAEMRLNASRNSSVSSPSRIVKRKRKLNEPDSPSVIDSGNETMNSSANFNSIFH